MFPNFPYFNGLSGRAGKIILVVSAVVLSSVVFSLINVNADVLPVSVGIAASPDTICRGQSTRISWSSENATSISIDNGIGNVSPYGDTMVSPQSTTTYRITGSNFTGASNSATATVFVNNCATPTPTPVPHTPTPNPVVPVSVGITVSPGTICIGHSTTLSWSSTNATTVSIDNGIGNVSAYGSRSVSPTSTTTYRITGSNVTGGHNSATATVFVNNCATPTPTPVPNPTVSIVANPAVICRGASAILSWSSANAVSANIQNYGPVAVSGQATVSPFATSTYRITVSNAVNVQASAQVTVTVNDCSTPTPTPTLTPTPTPPVVTIGVNPSQICRGNSTALSWSSTNTAGNAYIEGYGPVASNGFVTVSPFVTTTYRIIVQNAAGVQASAQATVTVVDCSTPTPTPTVTPNPTVTIQLNPGIVCRGQTSILSWSSANAHGQAFIDGHGSVPQNGSIEVYSDVTRTYRITVQNSAGVTASAQATLVVNNCTTPTPTPTPLGLSLSVSNANICVGNSTQLFWNTSNATSVFLSNVGNVAGSGQMTVSPFQTTTYTLTASNGFTSDSRSVTVFVSSCATPTPGPAQLSISKMVRNITTNTADMENVTSQTGHVLEFVVRVQNNGSNVANNVVVRDTLPTGLTYVSGSTRVDGQIQSDITNNIASALSLGDLFSGQVKEIRFRANAGSIFPLNQTANVINTAFASANNVPQVSDSASTQLFSTGTGIVAGAVTVETGGNLGWFLPALATVISGGAAAIGIRRFYFM